MRPRLVPAELLRRIGEHTGRAVGEGVEFAGIRPYVPGDQLRDVNRAVSLRRGQLHVNQRSAARAADLVVMIDAFGDAGPVSERALDLAVHGAAALVTAYLRVSDRAGLVVLGGMLRWLGPASGDRQFYRIAEMMLAARYDSFVTPDVGRIPRTALPPGTLVVVFSPLLDPRGFSALTDLRQRGFPLIVVDTLRDEPPGQDGAPTPGSRCAYGGWTGPRPAVGAAGPGRARAALARGTELDGVLAPLRQRPPAGARPARIPAARPMTPPASGCPPCPGRRAPSGCPRRMEAPRGRAVAARWGCWCWLAAGLGARLGLRSRWRAAAAVLGAAFTGWRSGPAVAVAAAVACCAFTRAGHRRAGGRGPVHPGLPAGRRRPRGPARSGPVGPLAQLPAAPGDRRPDRRRRRAGRARPAPGRSAWLTVAGLAAAVAAYLIALPFPRRGSDVDVQ